jgi:chromosome partitioning protein
MILSFIGQKGGIGKSTLAACVASELVARRRSVLLVDADPQKTSSTWHDIAAEHGHGAPSVVAMTSTLHKPHQVPKLAQSYDVTVIDCPPRLGDVQRSALMVADLAVLPCGPSAPDAWALAESLEMIGEAKTFRPKLRAYVCINKKRAGTALGQGARDALGKQSGLPVLVTEIGLRQAFQEAMGAGLGVTAYAPSDTAAAELRALVDELLALAPKRRTKVSS